MRNVTIPAPPFLVPRYRGVYVSLLPSRSSAFGCLQYELPVEVCSVLQDKECLEDGGGHRDCYFRCGHTHLVLHAGAIFKVLFFGSRVAMLDLGNVHLCPRAHIGEWYNTACVAPQIFNPG